MTQDTEDVVAELRAICDPNGLAGKAADLIQSLSDRIDVQVEAAYREGHCDGRFFVTSGEFSTEEIDWQASDARAALHQEGIATDVGRNPATHEPSRVSPSRP